MNAEQSNFVKENYLKMYDTLKTYARSSLRNESQAEEAVQEAYKIGCRDIEKFYNSPNPDGWIFLVLRNVVRNIKHNWATSTRIMTEYMRTHQQTDMTHQDQHSLELLYGGIVSDDEFRLLYEFGVEGKSHLEMAQSRGISISTCKKRLQRAKEKFREKLK